MAKPPSGERDAGRERPRYATYGDPVSFYAAPRFFVEAYQVLRKRVHAGCLDETIDGARVERVRSATREFTRAPVRALGA